MAADADRTQRLESCLGRLAAARVVKELIAPAQHDVGDDLLERGISFDLGPRPIGQLRRVEQFRQIGLDVGTEALEDAGLVEQRGWDDKHPLGSFIAHGVSSSSLPCGA